jgi:chromosome partitioning protein
MSRNGAQVVAVAGLKGGTGKTTTAVNVAAALAGAGYRVALVDTDAQASASLALGVAPHAGRGAPVAVEVALQRSGRALYVVPGGRGLAGASSVADHLAAGVEAAGAGGIVLVDCPPIFSPALLQTLRASVLCLAPVEPVPLSLPSLRELGHLIATLSPAPRLRAVWVRAQMRRALTREVLELAAQEWGSTLYTGQAIPEDARAAEAPGHALALEEYAPQSRAAVAYRELAEAMAADLNLKGRR